nr:RNA-directed DNA polymerase, eukaryota [Tanacetum cinerariifolium]
MVPDTIFSPIQEEHKHDNKSNFEEGEIQTEDPFYIYDLLEKKPKNDNREEESSKATLKHPSGFTPYDVLRTKDVQDVDDVVKVQENTQKSNKQDNFTKDNNFRGGILCAWDPRMFHKHNATISDYFVSIQGEWIANAKKWDGESILMGDLNKVWHKEERFGSIFNNHNAMVVNSFISSSGLVEVPLGGCAFTWCHKSDHRPIILREELLNKRMNVINSIHDLEKLEATEIAQKAKIKWSIEGDENSKFFHGILNKKRNKHAIRGILSEGEFLNKLSADQSIDLESNVTIEEIKRAVWDCGID